MVSDGEWAKLTQVYHSVRDENASERGSQPPKRPISDARGAIARAYEEFRLTEAEREVATRLVFGESPQSIALQREVSICTVRAQMSKIYAAADVSDRAEFTAEVVKRLILHLGT